MCESNEQSYWFVFYQDQLVLEQVQGYAANAEPVPGCVAVPLCAEPPLPVQGLVHPLGVLNGVACKTYVASALPEGDAAGNWRCMKLRQAFSFLDRPVYEVAGHGSQMIFWDKHSRFCCVCGTATALSTTLSKKCPKCGNEMFPPVYTAVIVLIRKGREILMVRSHNYDGPHYGLVAGFVETGESLEECVVREVREETALEIENLRYFGSQPWPYPSGLMVGFVADYKSGEIKIQESELSEARFFALENLPAVPPKLSIARRLIDTWVNEQRTCRVADCRAEQTGTDAV